MEDVPGLYRQYNRIRPGFRDGAQSPGHHLGAAPGGSAKAEAQQAQAVPGENSFSGTCGVPAGNLGGPQKDAIRKGVACPYKRKRSKVVSRIGLLLPPVHTSMG